MDCLPAPRPCTPRVHPRAVQPGARRMPPCVHGGGGVADVPCSMAYASARCMAWRAADVSRCGELPMPPWAAWLVHCAMCSECTRVLQMVASLPWEAAGSRVGNTRV